MSVHRYQSLVCEMSVPLRILFLPFPQALHEAQEGRRCGEAGRRDSRRHAHHDLCVRGHVLQHASATLLFLRPPGYSACTHT